MYPWQYPTSRNPPGPLGDQLKVPADALARLSAAHLASLLRGVLGTLDEEDLVVFVYDLQCLEGRLRELWGTFPEVEHHAAVKAVALPTLLRFVGACGLGAEVASLGELTLAERAGIPENKMVFDSPAKTVAELGRALEDGIRINADSLAEVERISQLLLAGSAGQQRCLLRINPQVGAGRIAATSVATLASKFGEPIENREAILASFARYPWLAGLHVHVGSQGCPLELLCEGIGRVVDLALEIESKVGRQLGFFNFGGGLPIPYAAGEHDLPGLAELRRGLEQRAPTLFDCRWRLQSEFGRYLFGPAGFAAARVEAVKVAGGENIAICHAGADLFVRTAYQPEVWSHELSVTSPDGRLKRGKRQPFTVAGPLCFSGDVLGKNRLLPEIEPGDWILVHDAGAYTLSMQSRYNSRLLPAVVGVQGRNTFLLKEREDLDDLLHSWV